MNKALFPARLYVMPTQPLKRQCSSHNFPLQGAWEISKGIARCVGCGYEHRIQSFRTLRNKRSDEG